MIFIVGARGRLGQALLRQYGPEQARCLERSVYERWSDPGAAAHVAAWFAPFKDSGATIYVTSGLLDPKLAPEEHARVNVDLPRNIIDGVAGLGLKVTTFGTVMEALLAQQNPYVRSKSALGSLVAARAATGAALCHVRVHTLFGGGQPSPFMFLGLMLDALNSGKPFKMTSGKQLREYHHVDDEAAAIRALDEAGVRGVVDLSHGQPLSLRELAGTVFEAFGAGHALQLGALTEPSDENYSTVFTRHPALAGAVFRDTLPALVDYMKNCAAKQEIGK
jgi:nucleoside-diphosphate-sugar epimerase